MFWLDQDLTGGTMQDSFEIDGRVCDEKQKITLYSENARVKLRLSSSWAGSG